MARKRICWKSRVTGAEGKGNFQDEMLAKQAVRRLKRERPTIQYWLEDEPEKPSIKQFQIWDGKSLIPGEEFAKMFKFDPDLCEVKVEGEHLTITQEGTKFEYQTTS